MAEQWEYMRVQVSFGKDDAGKSTTADDWAQIDQLGLEGWEAVGIAATTDSVGLRGGRGPFATYTSGFIVLFKRPVLAKRRKS
jgi:hypothetical protein